MGELQIEKIHSRPIEGSYLPPPIFDAHHKGLPTDSSIGPAGKADAPYKPSKPQLKGPLELQLIQAHSNINNTSKKAMKMTALQLNRLNIEMEAVTNRHVDALLKSAEAAQTGQTWSHLQQFGTLVLGLGNIGMGAYLVKNGSDTGGWMLIGAGVTALTGSALSHWFSSGEQKWYSIALPITIAALTIALSVAASDYMTTEPEVKDLLELLKGSSTLMLTAGHSYSEYVSTKANLGLISVQKDLHLKDQAVKALFLNTEILMKEFERILRVVKRTTRHTINQNIPA